MPLITKEQAKHLFTDFVLSTLKARKKAEKYIISSAVGCIAEVHAHTTKVFPSHIFKFTAIPGNEHDTVDGEILIGSDVIGFYDQKLVSGFHNSLSSHTCTNRELERWRTEIAAGMLVFIISCKMSIDCIQLEQFRTLKTVDDLLDFVQTGKFSYQIDGVYDFADIDNDGILKKSKIDDSYYFNLQDAAHLKIHYSTFISAFE